MKKISFIFLSLLLITLSSCNNFFQKSGDEIKANVELKLYSEAARNAFGPEQIDISNIESWTLKFTDTTNTSNVITKENEKAESGIISEYIPAGTYSLTVTGTYNGSTVEGKLSSITIETAKVTSKTVIVGFTTGETGTLDFTLVDLNCTSAVYAEFTDSPDNNYTAKLVKIGDKTTIIPLTLSITTKNNTALEADPYNLSSEINKLGTAEATDTFYVVSINKEGITSGDYYIHIYYNENPLIYTYNAVHIRDNKTSTKIDYSEDNGTKNFYVTNGTDEGSGLTSDYPVNIDSALTWLKKNTDTWSAANLYFSKSVSDTEDNFELIDMYTPKYDVTLNPATEDSNKLISVFVDGTQTSYISKGVYKFLFDNTNYLHLYSASGNETETVKVDINAGTLNLCLENVYASVTNSSTDKGIINVFIPESMATDYTEGSSTPFLTLNYTEAKESNEIETINLKVLDEDGEVSETVYDYKITASSDKMTYYFYTAKGKSSNPTIAKSIPDFSITGTTDKIEYSLNETTFGISTTSSFEDGTTFRWYLNDSLVCSTNEYTFVPAKEAGVNIGKNVLRLEAVLGNEIQTRTTEFDLNLYWPLMWNTTSIDTYNDDGYLIYSRPTTQYDFIPNTKISNPDFSSSFLSIYPSYISDVDFAFDGKSNAYFVTVDSSESKGYITRYTFNKNTLKYSKDINIFEYSTETYSDVKLYGDIDNNVLYFSMIDSSDSENNYMSIIKIENPQNITEVVTPAAEAAEGTTVTAKKYTLSSSLPSVYNENTECTYYVIISDFVVIENTAYIATDYNSPVYPKATITPYTLSETTTDGNTTYSCVADTTKTTLTDTDIYEIFPSFSISGNTCNVSITDMAVSGTCIYFIASRDSSVLNKTEPYQIQSGGGIVKLNLSCEIQNWSNGSKVLGWNSKDSVITITRYICSDNSITATKPESYNASCSVDAIQPANYTDYFIGPRKFIAIKPKQLLIADDGIFAINSNEDKKGQIYNVDKVVTLDLENETLSNVITKATFSGNCSSICCFDTANISD